MKTFDARGVVETESWNAEPSLESEKRPEVPKRYELLQELGRGGFAVVYAALDRQLDRKVALKVLQHRHSLEQQQRLVREAQVLAKLRHPHVVTVYDVTSHAGRVVIAMELVEGNTLRAWAKDKSFEQKLAACLAAGRGLAAVHDAELVHRDFKPDNVLVDEEGGVRVADFGLARIARSTDEDPPMAFPHGTEPLRTTTGALVGTLPYMAPELLQAKPADERSDQFAFAVSLVEVLGGKRPFDAAPSVTATTAKDEGSPKPSLDAYARAVAGSPTISDRIPSWVRTVITRALAADPAKRFESMAALLAELQRDPAGRRRVLALGGAVLLAGAIAAFALTRGEPALECDLPIALEAAWSPARAELVRQRLDTVKVPPAIRDFTLTTLDGYRAKLAASHETACRVRATEGATLAARRSNCLERRTAELASIAERLEHAEPALAAKAVSASGSLSSVEECESVALLGGAIDYKPGTADEGKRIAVETATLKVALDISADLATKTALDKLLERALKLDHPPTDGEVQLQLGRAYEDLDRIPEADKAFRIAVLRAQEGRDDSLLARAAFRLGLNIAKKQNKPADGRPWVELSVATLARLPPSPDLESKVMFALAIVELGSLRYDEAERAGSRAYELCVPIHGNLSNMCGQMINTLGGVALARRDLKLAYERYDRARVIAELSYGPDNIGVFAPLSNLASVAYGRGEFERSIEIRKDLVARANRTLGPKHFNVANVTLLLALSLERAGKLAEAIEATRVGLAGVEAARGPDFDRTREAKIQLARLLVRSGDLKAAEALKRVPLTPPMQVEAYEIEVELALRRRDVAAARAHAETALALAAPLARFEPASRIAVVYAKLLRDAKDPKAAAAAKHAIELVEAMFVPGAPPVRDARALLE